MFAVQWRAGKAWDTVSEHATEAEAEAVSKPAGESRVAFRARFSCLPHALRMELRDVIERHGGGVEGYQDDSVIVAIPRPSARFYAAMADDGRLEVVESSICYFPLGTDQAPEHQRHDGRYPGSRGFWLLGRWRPVAGLVTSDQVEA